MTETEGQTVSRTQTFTHTHTQRERERERVWESAVSFLSAEPRPKTKLVYSKAVRKQLVAIILNILSTMFYSKTINI